MWIIKDLKSNRNLWRMQCMYSIAPERPRGPSRNWKANSIRWQSVRHNCAAFKYTNILADSCSKTSIVVDEVIGSIELVNCKSVELQVSVAVPIINVDKSSACTIYLLGDSVSLKVKNWWIVARLISCCRRRMLKSLPQRMILWTSSLPAKLRTMTLRKRRSLSNMPLDYSTENGSQCRWSTQVDKYAYTWSLFSVLRLR